MVVMTFDLLSQVGTGLLLPDSTKKKGARACQMVGHPPPPPSLPAVGWRDHDLRSQLEADSPVRGEATTPWRASLRKVSEQ